jgi:hypothetical protein
MQQQQQQQQPQQIRNCQLGEDRFVRMHMHLVRPDSLDSDSDVDSLEDDLESLYRDWEDDLESLHDDWDRSPHAFMVCSDSNESESISESDESESISESDSDESESISESDESELPMLEWSDSEPNESESISESDESELPMLEWSDSESEESDVSNRKYVHSDDRDNVRASRPRPGQNFTSVILLFPASGHHDQEECIEDDSEYDSEDDNSEDDNSEDDNSEDDDSGCDPNVGTNHWLGNGTTHGNM